MDIYNNYLKEYDELTIFLKKFKEKTRNKYIPSVKERLDFKKLSGKLKRLKKAIRKYENGYIEAFDEYEENEKRLKTLKFSGKVKIKTGSDHFKIKNKGKPYTGFEKEEHGPNKEKHVVKKHKRVLNDGKVVIVSAHIRGGKNK